jgi:hypothetical protein
MAGLDPAIRVFLRLAAMTWMPRARRMEASALQQADFKAIG